MSVFEDTSGNATLGLGICGRCKQRFPLGELYDDPNAPGLKVCTEDKDQYDPWRLPPRQPEPINLPFTRPDVKIEVPGSGGQQPQATLTQTDDGRHFWDI